MRLTAVVRMVAACCAATLLVAACSVPTEERPVEISARTMSVPQIGQGGGDRPVAREWVGVFLVRDGRLQSVRRRVIAGTEPVPALEELVAGPTDREAARGLTSSLPPGTARLPVRVQGRLAVIELPAELARLGPVDQVHAVGQIVLTVTSGDHLRSVRFVDDEGLLIDVPTGSGRLVSRPVGRADYRAITAT